MADRYGIARRPVARESRVRFTLAFLCLILLLSVPGLVAAAGETTDAASHQHLWKQTGSLGESRYFTCETCGEKRTVQIHTSYGAQGSYLISPYDGRCGAPADSRTRRTWRCC